MAASTFTTNPIDLNKLLQKFEAGSDRDPEIEPATLDGYLKSHFIDPLLLRSDDFKGFMADRQAKLLGLIEEAMGSKALAGGDSDADGDSGDDEEPVAAPQREMA